MCRHRSQRFDASASSVREARTFLRETLGDWELVEPLEVATLLASELVTNAIVHAGTPLEVSLDVSENVLEVAVADEDAQLPPSPSRTDPPAAWEAEGGRGLSLLSSLAQEWGITVVAGGKQVWFRLDTGASWSYRDDCLCPAGAPAVARLRSSGGAVVDAFERQRPHGHDAAEPPGHQHREPGAS